MQELYGAASLPSIDDYVDVDCADGGVTELLTDKEIIEDISSQEDA